jgi:aryl-alcohol dehydrogenase-like predicted oxidoreductase
MNSIAHSKEIRTASRLVLGTAQLGMPYGIANRTGQPDFKTAVSIIENAWENGIREFDTAQAYGESEVVLGRALSSLGISNDVRIITKLDPKLEPQRERTLKSAIKRSLERLHVPSLYGLMLHREEWLGYLKNGLENILRGLILQGTVQHIGISLYTPVKALQALESDIFDMIQVSANILDHRFADAGVFDLADEKEKQIYIRSVFLQGLLLMKPEDLPPNLALAKPVLCKIDVLCKRYEYSRQELSLLYIKEKYPQAKIVFGAETPAQLKQNINIWRDSSSTIHKINELDRLSNIDERIINPSCW